MKQFDKVVLSAKDVIKNYQELHEYLEKADYSLFEINPNESLEFLGLFTRDIVNKFSQEIETPSFLEKFI